eukprot:2890228-Rhodomonas_salina.1
MLMCELSYPRTCADRSSSMCCPRLSFARCPMLTCAHLCCPMHAYVLPDALTCAVRCSKCARTWAARCSSICCPILLYMLSNALISNIHSCGQARKAVKLAGALASAQHGGGEEGSAQSDGARPRFQLSPLLVPAELGYAFSTTNGGVQSCHGQNRRGRGQYHAFQLA